MIPFRIKTAYGDLIPCYDSSDVRKRYREALERYPSGALRSIYLQDRAVIWTQVGKIHAELLTFYECGTIKRVFPTYGKISAYHTEEDEYDEADQDRLVIGNSAVAAKMQCVYFDRSGYVKSITIFNKDRMNFATKYGMITTDLGAEFNEDGGLVSIESVFATELYTDFGTLHPFNPHRDPMHAEKGSLGFDDNGDLRCFCTVRDRIVITEDTGTVKEYVPQIEEDPYTGFPLWVAVKVILDEETIRVSLDKKTEEVWDRSRYRLIIDKM